MEILYLARYKNCKQVFGILRRTMLTQQRRKEPSAYSGRQQHLFSHWYDADGERTVKTSGENEAIYVNSEFSGGNTGTARFSLYVSPYLVAGQGGKYTKHIYIGSQRIVSKLGDLASYGADPRRIPYAGNEADGLTINYKDKYNQQLQSIKDNYKAFDQPYNGKDNDDYVNGQVCLKDIVGCTRESLSKLTFLSFARQFCCNDATPEAALARAMARTRAANGNFKPNDDYEKMQFYYHPDHLGSSSYITNLDGEVAQHIEYVPFGEVFIEERNNTWNTPYLFNAKEFDEETGMYYYGARYYEPRLSLWLSIDVEEEDFPDFSSYVYCKNNPIIFLDHNGDSPTLITAGIGGAIGGVIGGAIEMGAQLVNNGKITSWKSVGGAAAQGAITGAVAGLTGGASLIASAAVSAGANVIGGEVNRRIQGKHTTVGDVVSDAAIGGAFGAGGSLENLYGKVSIKFLIVRKAESGNLQPKLSMLQKVTEAKVMLLSPQERGRQLGEYKLLIMIMI